MSMNNLVPKFIIDKNGKSTTVHVSTDKKTADGNRANNVTAPTLAAKPVIGAQQQGDQEALNEILIEPLEEAVELLRSKKWNNNPTSKNFPVELKERIIEAVNHPFAFVSADVLAEAHSVIREAGYSGYDELKEPVMAAVGRWHYAQSEFGKLVNPSAMAADPRTDVEILDRIYRDEHHLVSRNLAKNPNTPAWILESMSNSPDRFLRAEVAKNPATSPEILTRLSGDQEDFQIVRAVAMNPNTPESVSATIKEGRPASIFE